MTHLDFDRAHRIVGPSKFASSIYAEHLGMVDDSFHAVIGSPNKLDLAIARWRIGNGHGTGSIVWAFDRQLIDFGKLHNVAIASVQQRCPE